jgi:hypothetical protein
VRLFNVEVLSARKHYLVYPSRTANSAKLALFRQWLHDEIELERSLATPIAPRAVSKARQR